MRIGRRGAKLAMGTAAMALLAFGPPALADMAPLHFVTEEYPWFNYTENGQIVGAATDLVKLISQRAGVPMTLDLVPWTRAYHQALDDPESCVFSTTLTDERRPLFKWVTPLVSNDWTLYGRADSTIVLKSLEDARPYPVAVYYTDVQEGFFESQVGFRIVRGPDRVANIRQLLAGRADLVAGDVLLEAVARRNNLTGIKPLLTFKHVELGLACNRAIEDDVITRLNAALHAAELDGTAEAIRRDYARR